MKDARILLLGITFKENCPDIRNTKVVDIYHTFREYTSNVTVCDPWANIESVKHEYGIAIVRELPVELYDAVVLCVAHDEFRNIAVRKLLKEERGVVYDVKGCLDAKLVDGRL